MREAAIYGEAQSTHPTHSLIAAMRGVAVQQMLRAYTTKQAKQMRPERNSNRKAGIFGTEGGRGQVGWLIECRGPNRIVRMPSCACPRAHAATCMHARGGGEPTMRAARRSVLVNASESVCMAPRRLKQLLGKRQAMCFVSHSPWHGEQACSLSLKVTASTNERFKGREREGEGAITGRRFGRQQQASVRLNGGF